MSASQRNKGAGGERELCVLLTDAFGQKVKRQLGQARDSGCDVTVPPFHIEVKRRSRIGNLYEWILQAEGAEGGQVYSGVRFVTPVVALRADGKDWLVVMRLHDWIKLAREEIAK